MLQHVSRIPVKMRHHHQWKNMLVQPITLWHPLDHKVQHAPQKVNTSCHHHLRQLGHYNQCVKVFPQQRHGVLLVPVNFGLGKRKSQLKNLENLTRPRVSIYWSSSALCGSFITTKHSSKKGGQWIHPKRAAGDKKNRHSWKCRILKILYPALPLHYNGSGGRGNHQ